MRIRLGRGVGARPAARTHDVRRRRATRPTLRSLVFYAGGAACGVSACGVADTLVGSEQGSKQVLWSVSSVTTSSQPALDDAAVYSLGLKHELAAVDRQTQRVLWRDTLPVSDPLSGGFNVILSAGLAIAGDHDVYAVDVRTGRPVWSFTPAGGTLPGRSRLVISDGVVYTGSLSNHVYALRGATGVPVWDVTVSSHPGQTRVHGPAVADGVVYAAYTDLGVPWSQAGNIVALDAATGAVLWSRVLPFHSPSPTGSNFVVAPPAVSGEVVLVGTDEGYIYGLSRAGGSILWTIPPTPPSPGNINNVPSGDIRPLVAVGSTVYAGSSTGWVVAIDVPSGTVRWTVLPQQYYGTAAWLAADDQTVYVVHPYGQMSALSAVDGSVRWQIGTKVAPALAAPAVGRGVVYFGGIDGLYAAAAR